MSTAEGLHSLNIAYRIATAIDADAIAAMVNKAYRPLNKTKGWTHEAHLIAGPRISPEQVKTMINPGSVVLVMSLDREIVACVHVQSESNAANIGMLAVLPAYQAQGLGKGMLALAERYAAEIFHARTLRMSVISRRPELIEFYERRGYTRTGLSFDYPVSAGAGHPLADGVKIEILAKPNP